MRANLPIQLHHFLGITVVRTILPACYRAYLIDVAALILDLNRFAHAFVYDGGRRERTRFLEVMVMVPKGVRGRFKEWEIFFEEHVGLRCGRSG